MPSNKVTVGVSLRVRPKVKPPLTKTPVAKRVIDPEDEDYTRLAVWSALIPVFLVFVLQYIVIVGFKTDNYDSTGAGVFYLAAPLLIYFVVYWIVDYILKILLFEQVVIASSILVATLVTWFSSSWTVNHGAWGMVLGLVWFWVCFVLILFCFIAPLINSGRDALSFIKRHMES